MPLYMDPALTKLVSPALKKRMQGKTLPLISNGPGERADRGFKDADGSERGALVGKGLALVHEL